MGDFRGGERSGKTGIDYEHEHEHEQEKTLQEFGEFVNSVTATTGV
jgi:hypothetical protein